MEKSSNYYRQNQDGQQILAQWIIEEVIPHGAIGEKGNHIVKAPKRTPDQRDDTHDPKASVGDHGNEVCES